MKSLNLFGEKTRNPKDSDATLRGGLEKGCKQIKHMSSTPEGTLTLAIMVGSMFWLFLITPATCMKLDEVFPETGIYFFTGLVMYGAWLASLLMLDRYLRKLRNRRLSDKPKPSPEETLHIIRIRKKYTFRIKKN